MDNNETKMLENLFVIIEELHARSCSFNSIHPPMRVFGWDDLCDKGIRLLEQLKK